MPLHTNNPGSKNLVFVQPKNGKFMVSDGGVDTEYQAIEGSLDLVRIEFDPGNPSHKIMPYDAFIMHIERNFTYSVARVLGDLDKGEQIIAKAQMGNDPMITFCNILKKDATGNMVKPNIVDLPEGATERVNFVKRVVESHPAYAPKNISTE
jgi:hypothetical protein